MFPTLNQTQKNIGTKIKKSVSPFAATNNFKIIYIA